MAVDSISSSVLSSAQGGLQLYQNNMGKDAFLELLVTQLRYQDPLKPMENTEFLAQLSQFSSLEQLWNVNETLGQNVDLTQSVNNALMTNLIGKEVKVSGNVLYWEEGAAPELSFQLAQAGEVAVEILDSDGRVVRTIQLGSMTSGEHSFSWDGRDDSGNRLAEGDYTASVTRKDANGNEIAVSTYLVGKVDGIEFIEGSPIFYIDNYAVNPSDIFAVYESEGNSQT